jgi:putative restriction endonuclease
MSRAVAQYHEKDLAYYCNCFAKLNVSKTKERGAANHKPILILSVLELIDRQSIVKNCILVSDELIDTFKQYWGILAAESSYTDALHYPFVHLQSDGFWSVKFKDTFDGSRIKTTNKLKEWVEYAYLDDELFALLQDPSTRQILIDSLVATWFAGNQIQLDKIIDIDRKFDRADKPELANLDSKIKFTLRKSRIRNAFFRKSVVSNERFRSRTNCPT